MFIKDVIIDWNKIEQGSYLRTIPALRDLNCITFHKPVVFFVGENGSGKSTLLEAMAIADGFNPEGGTRNYAFSTFQSHSELYQALRLSRTTKADWGYFLRAESFYNVATMEEEYSKDANAHPMHFHEQSHGESFMALAQHFFKRRGLYFLDEPEAALSPQRQLALLAQIHRCRKEGSQFFIVTHSPILLGLPDAEILTFDEGNVHPCAYEDTDSFRITELFMLDRERLLYKLLDNQ